MNVYRHVNDGDDLQVRLTYSNAALLEKMNVHVVEENPPETEAIQGDGPDGEIDARHVNPFGTFPLTDDGAYLMPYEQLINPDVVESKPLHWPWRQVKEHLDKLEALGTSYVGRRLYLLYNPATGRTNGTTHELLRDHDHPPAATSSTARTATPRRRSTTTSPGSGHSTVEGKGYEWKAGDLMLSAPGWGVHNHASTRRAGVRADHPGQPAQHRDGVAAVAGGPEGSRRAAGRAAGFETNRDQGRLGTMVAL